MPKRKKRKKKKKKKEKKALLSLFECQKAKHRESSLFSLPTPHTELGTRDLPFLHLPIANCAFEGFPTGLPPAPLVGEGPEEAHRDDQWAAAPPV